MPIYSNRQLKPAPAPLVLVPFKGFVAGFKGASAGWVSLHQHSHPAPFEGSAASWVCLHWQRNPAPGSGAGRVSTSPGPSTRCRWRFILVPVPIESDWPRHLAHQCRLFVTGPRSDTDTWFRVPNQHLFLLYRHRHRQRNSGCAANK